jgi:hypothetical protein
MEFPGFSWQRYPDRFYNFKIGIPWADLERRLDAMTVLALCGDAPLEKAAPDKSTWRSMGVDTGKALHVVILRSDPKADGPERVVFLGKCREFSDLDPLMARFEIGCCVIDGLPDTLATREPSQRVNEPFR